MMINKLFDTFVLPESGKKTIHIFHTYYFVSIRPCVQKLRQHFMSLAGISFQNCRNRSYSITLLSYSVKCNPQSGTHCHYPYEFMHMYTHIASVYVHINTKFIDISLQLPNISYKINYVDITYTHTAVLFDICPRHVLRIVAPGDYLYLTTGCIDTQYLYHVYVRTATHCVSLVHIQIYFAFIVQPSNGDLQRRAYA